MADHSISAACELNMRNWYLRRVRAAGGSVCRSGGITWGYTAEPFALAGSHQIVPFPQRSPHDSTDSIQRMLGYFRDRGGVPWTTCGGVLTPDAIRHELKARGFHFAFPGVGMAADLTRSDHGGADGLPDVRITENLTPEMLGAHPSYGSMKEAGGRRSLATSMIMARDRPTRVWNAGVVRNGTLIGSLMILIADGVAGIYDLGVRPEDRRQHVATALVRAACRHAHEHGIHTAVLQNDPSLIPLYAQLGFAVVTRIDHWRCPKEALEDVSPSGAALTAARASTTIVPEKFLIAALTDDTSTARRILLEHPAIAKTAVRGSDGATPLHIAAYQGALDAVQMLIEAGADVSARDQRFHSTALSWAVYGLGRHGPVFKRDQVGAATALLRAGATLTPDIRRTLEADNPQVAGVLDRIMSGRES
jgi:ribosomal protein S18 acetylase RimI-like enzyme